MDASTLKSKEEIDKERGRRAEERFFEAMVSAPSSEMPKWILCARRTISLEDRYEGKDAIIETLDAGEFFVQIKSSNAGKRHFQDGRHYKRNRSIIVVVIKETDSLSDIRAKVRKPLARLRQDLLQFQYHICNKQGS